MRNMMKLLARSGAVVTASAMVAQSTYAAGLADLAAGIDSTDILAGFTAVALLLAGILAARMGIRKVLGLIK